MTFLSSAAALLLIVVIFIFSYPLITIDVDRDDVCRELQRYQMYKKQFRQDICTQVLAMSTER